MGEDVGQDRGAFVDGWKGRRHGCFHAVGVFEGLIRDGGPMNVVASLFSSLCPRIKDRGTL